MAPPDNPLMDGRGADGEAGDAAESSEALPVVEEPGKTIAGRYEILRNLAEGGMGSVYVARQLDLNREVALKVIGGDDADLQERFRREAVALADISHPAVVEVYDFIGPSAATQGRSYLVMAYVPGQNLEEHLTSLAGGHLDTQALVDLFLPVASAVVELHANGIIHRDLKPGNLVFAARADGHSSIKLVDFGIAKRELEEGLTAAGFVLGTPAYMAPEAMVGGEKTPAGDVYALGATMFELATGEAPYGSGTTAEILRRAMTEEPHLPRHLQGSTFGALLIRMLGRDKDHRPSALQVFREMEKIEHELYRPPSQSILPAVPLAELEVEAEADSAEIPLGESPLVTLEPPDRPELLVDKKPVAEEPEPEPEPKSEPKSESERSIYAPVLASGGDVAPAPERAPSPPPPARNWSKLFVLVVGPMVLVALAAALWLRMDAKKHNSVQRSAGKPPPSAMEPAAMEPAAMEPIAMKPIAMKPIAMEPIAMEPAAMEPAAMEPAAMEPAAMEPAAMEPAAMEPSPMEPSPMEPSAMEPAVVVAREPGPELKKLIRGCRKKEGAKKLHRKARRALRKPATRVIAEQALKALLTCKGSKRWRRRTAAQQLAELYARMGRCGDAARAWKDYLDRIPKAQKKKGPPPPPKCPAPTP